MTGSAQAAQKDASSRAENAVDRRLFAALALFALLPTLVTPIPAMVDYVNHLARMYVLAADGTANASPFYRVHFALYPNLAMDLVVPRLARLVGVELATRLFLLAAQVLVVSGAVAIELAVKRRHEIAGLMALAMLSCAPFAWGFLNFEFALGAALWGIACRLMLERCGPAVRLLVHAAFCAALFVAHLFALGLYGVTLVLHELWRARDQRISVVALAARLLGLAAPAAVLLALMARSGGSVGGAGNEWHLAMKPFALFAILDGYSIVLSTLGMLVLLGLVHALHERRALRLEASGAWIAAGLGLLYLAVPSRMLDTALVDLRVLVAAFLILPGFLSISFPDARWRRTTTCALVALVLANAGLTAVVWTSYRADYRALIASFGQLGKGARVLVAINGAEEDPPLRDLTLYPMYHAPTLAVAYAGAFVPTLFTSAGKQPVEVREPWTRLANSCGGPVPTALLAAIAEGRPLRDVPGFVATWQRDFDFVYVVGAPSENPIPERLEPIDTQARFTLYRIRKAARAMSAVADLRQTKNLEQGQAHKHREAIPSNRSLL